MTLSTAPHVRDGGSQERDMKFADREDAGQRLGLVLRRDLGAEREDVVVIGLSRDGILVASEIARLLEAPLDVLVVREFGVPGGSVVGAVGEGGVRVLENGAADALGLDESAVRALEMRERIEVERQARRFRGERPRRPLAGATVLIVDDGMASVSATRAASAIARAEGAARVLLAVPAVSSGRARLLAVSVDELVTLDASAPDGAEATFYEAVSELTDEGVVRLLQSGGSVADAFFDGDVEIDLGQVRLTGHLSVESGCRGVVVFSHGSGSSRHSPRNVFVAGELRRAGLGTLLFDLLTGAEEGDRRNVFDIELLAERLLGVTSWLRRRPEVAGARIGYFGASTGAAAALWAAADSRVAVSAVVSRGGRPDLAESRLPSVTAPTLLIVGGEDRHVLELNRRAAAQMTCPNRIWVVPGAGHLFSEPGALETVADLARVWFGDHLLHNDRADVTGGR